MSNKTATLEDAIVIATEAHTGIKDKAGAPYILHPLRMMMRMKSEEAMIVAVLHDVVEDTRAKENEEDKWTFDRLRDEGFSANVINALDCVTNRDDESYEDFIERAKTNSLACEVKIADLEDNMNIQRIGTIQVKDLERLGKYHKSWRILTEASKS